MKFHKVYSAGLNIKHTKIHNKAFFVNIWQKFIPKALNENCETEKASEKLQRTFCLAQKLALFWLCDCLFSHL